KAFVIAAPYSGSGKTSITLGLIRAYTKRGLIVQPFKVGPDFIDPMHHELAVNSISDLKSRNSINLDSWMLGKSLTLETFYRNSQGADVCIIEGVMGLFDGKDGKTEVGSTAEIAKWLNIPVVLCIDCWAMSRSVAAMLKGFIDFDQEVRVEAVVFNRVGGEIHTQWLRDAVEKLYPPEEVLHHSVKILGGLPKSADITIPERHLGLLMPADFVDDSYISVLARLIENFLDVDALLAMASIDIPNHVSLLKLPKTTNKRIGIARDEAFCFYYHDNESLLRSNGAELVYFSPLHDKVLPDNLDSLYFGGGYPELFAEKLANNISFKESVVKFVLIGNKAVYGECGGLMYLSRGIYQKRDANINSSDIIFHEMLNLLPFKTKMVSKLHMGYVEVVVNSQNLFEKGMVAKGHLFHYSEITEEEISNNVEPAYVMSMEYKRESILEGYEMLIECGKSVIFASYVHLHWGSNPKFAQKFVEFSIINNK
ncbi:hypothetical protein HK096_004453, partial [Nowakowskiella sp. JEL0078]